VVGVALPASLYQRVLGEAFAELHPLVRRVHDGHDGLAARGRFVVRRGEGWVAAMMAAVLRLPRAGDDVPVLLEVSAQGDAEIWRRTFGDRVLCTEQREGPGGVVLERMGLVELSLRMVAAAGALAVESVGAAICLGSLRVPLPRLLAPRVSARACADVTGERLLVQVRTFAPWGDLVISYEGALDEGVRQGPAGSAGVRGRERA